MRNLETVIPKPPGAKTCNGGVYYMTYQQARDLADATGRETVRVRSYTKGWAVQLYDCGPYLGDERTAHEGKNRFDPLY